ncbi:MAG: MOSC domain-containing protein [Anaerolinea sp.]|nr:MOSC domain-containing protein [Anaerolinea sp.]
MTREALRAGLLYVRQSPADQGRLEMIVARPAENERHVWQTAELSVMHGLQGDDWQQRGSSRTADGAAHPGRQITLMNSRAIQLIAQSRERWPLAGDQLYVDLNLSPENLPPGQKLQVGTAVLEITDQEHRGCLKFAQRFGHDALKFVNQDGWPLRLRGVYARVVQPGQIQTGDTMRKI